MKTSADKFSNFIQNFKYYELPIHREFGKLYARNDIRNKDLYDEYNIAELDKQSILTIKQSLSDMLKLCDNMLNNI